MPDIFERASRLNPVYTTVQGSLYVSDLWKLPLTSNNAKVATLDTIAIELDQQLKNAGTVSFVKKTTTVNDELRLKFDIVLHIIGVRQKEAEEAELREQNATKKKELLALIAKKETDAMGEKSIDELRALVNGL